MPRSIETDEATLALHTRRNVRVADPERAFVDAYDGSTEHDEEDELGYDDEEDGYWVDEWGESSSDIFDSDDHIRYEEDRE